MLFPEKTTMTEGQKSMGSSWLHDHHFCVPLQTSPLAALSKAGLEALFKPHPQKD